MTYSYLIKAASGRPFSYWYKTKLPLSDKSYQQQNRQKDNAAIDKTDNTRERAIPKER